MESFVILRRNFLRRRRLFLWPAVDVLLVIGSCSCLMGFQLSPDAGCVSQTPLSSQDAYLASAENVQYSRRRKINTSFLRPSSKQGEEGRAEMW